MSALPTPDCDPPPAEQAAAKQPLPAGTCDAHFHVFGPHDRYPLDPRRNYTPHTCTLAQYRAAMKAAGIARAVFVQPSVYGTDHRLLIDTLSQGGADFRGVAVLPAGIASSEIEQLHQAGVRGMRLNLVNPQVVGLEETIALARDVAQLGWHLQVFVDAQVRGAELAALCQRVPAPVVVDHMGRLAPGSREGLLFDLLREGACWVKLSAPYRVSRQPPPHDDLLALVQQLVQSNASQLVWGSDWPHTEQHAGVPTAASLVALLHRWIPDASLLRQICVENPARLYQFD